MTETTLVAKVGREQGSPASRRLRAEGRVPGVLYGHGMEPLSLSVDGKELRAALSGEAGTRALLRLDVEGTQHLAIAHELQRHPVRGTVAHVDFLAVSRHEKIHVDLPIVLTGRAEEVDRQGGLVEHTLTSLSVNVPADSIPPSIEADVSGLRIGDALHVRDLVLPRGVEAQADADLLVAVAHAGRMEAELAAAEEGQAAQEAPQAEGAEPQGSGEAEAEAAKQG